MDHGRIKQALGNSPVTQFWLCHPNTGWEPCPPCRAGDALVLFKWPIRLGTPPINGTVEGAGFLLLQEAMYWEARHKNIREDSKLLNLCHTIADRLRVGITDEQKEAAVEQVAIRLDHEAELDRQAAQLRIDAL